jgi:5,10-methylene-tetrahydrofolate dehydrogenase/methenyl tetrahydrofolate cyclohydrolase
MQQIDGKAISEQVKQEIAAEVAEIVANGGKRPHLAAILVGHDGGSETYVAAKWGRLPPLATISATSAAISCLTCSDIAFPSISCIMQGIKY